MMTLVSLSGLLLIFFLQKKFIGPRTVDVHIAWLRQKLEENPQTPRYIVTVRGEGYSFEA
jgi:two-component system alkaline phosphatase synthesis response regulator PhoP